MKISTKGRYATRALLDLALCTELRQRPCSIKDISEKESISGLYLTQIFAKLKAAGLIRSVRGSQGGFFLRKDPADIRIIDILTSVEGNTSLADCIDDPGLCEKSPECVTRILWHKAQRAMEGVLESTTLADLLQRRIDIINNHRKISGIEPHYPLNTKDATSR
ncbi:MAG: Rrf2 family transcriptional regulator [Deltaproteobacteria bacterium]|nr:Rrf2 family transcriptional regulator [Deltaproteobacteria bacterium]